MVRKDVVFFSFVAVWAGVLFWVGEYWPNFLFIAAFAVLTAFKLGSRRFSKWLETPLKRHP